MCAIFRSSDQTSSHCSRRRKPKGSNVLTRQEAFFLTCLGHFNLLACSMSKGISNEIMSEGASQLSVTRCTVRPLNGMICKLFTVHDHRARLGRAYISSSSITNHRVRLTNCPSQGHVAVEKSKNVNERLFGQTTLFTFFFFSSLAQNKFQLKAFANKSTSWRCAKKNPNSNKFRRKKGFRDFFCWWDEIFLCCDLSQKRFNNVEFEILSCFTLIS